MASFIDGVGWERRPAYTHNQMKKNIYIRL